MDDEWGRGGARPPPKNNKGILILELYYKYQYKITILLINNNNKLDAIDVINLIYIAFPSVFLFVCLFVRTLQAL